MTTSPRAARSLDEALSQALEDFEAGLGPLQVLDRYHQYETELAPLLETAYRLRTTRWPALSLAARVSGRERMHAALAEQRARRRYLVPPLWRQVGAGVALVILAGTTYLASPVSPLRSMNRPGVTPTVPVSAAATWTVTPSQTWEPPATAMAIATPVASPTTRMRRTAEPTELVDRVIAITQAPLPSATVTASPTHPRATRTKLASPTATMTITPSATPTESATPVVVAPVQPPATPEAPTVLPSPSALPPTAIPPTPSPTATPTPTALPTQTPVPTETAAPRRTPKPSRTPQPTHTATPAVPLPSATLEWPLPKTAPSSPVVQGEDGRRRASISGPPGMSGSGNPGGDVKERRSVDVAPGQQLRAAPRHWRSGRERRDAGGKP